MKTINPKAKRDPLENFILALLLVLVLCFTLSKCGKIAISMGMNGPDNAASPGTCSIL